MPDPTALLLAGAALASLLGFAWLALAMDEHWLQVRGDAPVSPTTRLVLRLLGTASLLASAVLCLLADRPSMAVLVWLMLMVISVPLVGLMLAWRPRLLRVVWPAGGPG